MVFGLGILVNVSDYIGMPEAGEHFVHPLIPINTITHFNKTTFRVCEMPSAFISAK